MPGNKDIFTDQSAFSINTMELMNMACSELLLGQKPQKYLEKIFNFFSPHLDLDAYFFFRTDGTKKQLSLKSFGGIDEQKVKSIPPLVYGETFHCHKEFAPSIRRILTDIGFTTYTTFPLISKGKFLGCLSFGSKKLPDFPDETVSILQSVSDLMAAAIDNHSNSKLLNKKAKEFGALVENSPDVITQHDPKGRILYVNPQIGSIMDAEPKKWIGKTPEELDISYPEVFLKKWRKCFQKTLETKQPQNLEFDFFVKSNPVYLKSTNVPLFNAGGEVESIMSVTRDVTQLHNMRKKLSKINAELEQRVHNRTRQLEETNKQLLNANQRFFALYNSSPVAISLITENKKILDINESFCRITGYKRNELTGRILNEEMFPSTNLSATDWICIANEKGSVENQEQVFRKKNGQILNILISCRKIQVSTQPVYIFLFVDITTQKKSESKIRELSGALAIAEKKERGRIGSIIQNDITALISQLEMRFHLLEMDMSNLPESPLQSKVMRKLDELGELSQRAIQSCQTLLLELNPPVDRDETIDSSLAWLVVHMSERYGFNANFVENKKVTVPSPDRRFIILQLVRELLFYIMNHFDLDDTIIHVDSNGSVLLVKIEVKGGPLPENNNPPDSNLSNGNGSDVEKILKIFGGNLQVTNGSVCHHDYVLEIPID